MQGLESSSHLDEYAPYVILVEGGLVLLVLDYLLIDVAIRRILHHYAQALLRVLYESLLVTDHVGMSNRRQYSNFIQCIFSFFL
jgi:hypothetical protein